jgi:hypothetical protein
LWLGVGFGILALMMIVFGTLRQRMVTRALDEGTFAALHPAVVVGVAALMTALTLATIVTLFLGT